MFRSIEQEDHASAIVFLFNRTCSDSHIYNKKAVDTSPLV